jgi:oligopeptide transport system ATP-binding protein
MIDRESKTTDAVIRVEDLHVSFQTDDGLVEAVRGVSFEVYPGETVGIVGESGSGKSVTNLAIMGLIPKPPGRIDRGRAIMGGKDLLQMTAHELQQVRGRKIGMIFQDPMTALNPLMTVGDQLTEVTRWHLGLSRHDADQRATEMLGLVGIASPEQRLRQYPHQFSGGMRQRVMIAMALSCEPELLIADEPTTALDVTIQAQILDLLSGLQQRRSTSIILITHDLGVVAGACDRVMVMYAGRVVEKANVNPLFASPQHPYTIGLLDSLPRLDGDVNETLRSIAGQPPDMARLPEGCAFRARCPRATDQCATDDPALVRVDAMTDGERAVACWNASVHGEQLTSATNHAGHHGTGGKQ